MPNIPNLDIQPIFYKLQDREFTGEGDTAFDAGKGKKTAVKNATISLSFSLDRLAGSHALVSKDVSGDGKGEFTIWVRDGQIYVSISDGDDTHWRRVKDIVLGHNDPYHLAVSTGKDGLQIWLNGVLFFADPELKIGLKQNDESLVIGGTRAWRDADDDAQDLPDGTIGNVMVFDKQLDQQQIVALTAHADATLGAKATMALRMGELAPVNQQLHHGSDTLKDILAEYGVNHHGHFSSPLAMRQGDKGDNTINGTAAADGINGRKGDDEIHGLGGDDVLQGGYGNDLLKGGKGDDILDGGHGEDVLRGGAGNDLLISRADGREGKVAYDPDRDEGDPYKELTKGKLYPDQPIPGDDVMIGGAGADIFYFQTLINAKERFIEEHTNDNGTIHWHGVAGENDNIHDHWVDVLGDEVIMDYVRADGDRIVIEGHTTEIQSITYGDADRDGVMDHSVITLYSDQGNNGGAHNDDLLGTITVYGDLVKLSDIEHTAAPAYGIVNTINDLDEAITPKQVSKDKKTPKPPENLPDVKGHKAASGDKPVFVAEGAHKFHPDDRAPLVFNHKKRLDLKDGTIAMSFKVKKLGETQALFSKDARDMDDPGHLTAYVNEDGDLVVRIQDGEKSHYLVVEEAIEKDEVYDLAVSFGKDGVRLFLNGAQVAYDEEVTVGWDDNREALIIGASGWSNTPGETDKIHSHLHGNIFDVRVFDTQLTADEVFGTDPRSDFTYFSGSALDFKFGKANDGSLEIRKGNSETKLSDENGFFEFDDFTGRVQDVTFGTGSADRLDGDDTADVLIGRGNNDTLVGGGNDDLLLGGEGDDEAYGQDGRDLISLNSGNDRADGGTGRDTIYGGPGDDTLTGGTGADRFYGGIGDDTYYGNSWRDGSGSKKDKVVFDGDFDDYTFSTQTFFNGARGEDVTAIVVQDSANGGKDGLYEGKDILIDIDVLVFADQTVDAADLL